MIRLAFSTVACPDWTLQRVFDSAERWGFEGVELRSFGYGGADFACEPGLTSTEKVRAHVARTGVEIAGLATGLRYDAPIWPPVLGYALGSFDAPIAATKPFVDLAVAIGAPSIRVFGFETPDGERAGRLARRRIIDRLRLAADAVHHTGVRLLVENGGSFARGADIAELISELDSRDVAACYSLAPASLAGESPEAGVRALGRRLAAARVKDLRSGKPVELGTGDLPCHDFVRAIAAARLPLCLVHEWDAAWVPGLTPAEQAVPRAAETLYTWLAEAGALARPTMAAG